MALVHSDPRYCRWCGRTKARHARHADAWANCWHFQPQDKPTCRVCGSGFDPRKSGREDCCYRHRLDS